VSRFSLAEIRGWLRRFAAQWRQMFMLPQTESMVEDNTAFALDLYAPLTGNPERIAIIQPSGWRERAYPGKKSGINSTL
jgi:hypothetical protein